ncbi:sulfite exporter TauE/SafE family protein [Labrys wisconsinensis]|uniref:Probable membrane transporter protein n=1 Tax=Labrys wisconsinensis TaxID=425677 RepID=A0ABU0JA82_9HYPH|nr:sulfite exporter TauE/SafE family protein [Labrys wisconsinensis]MDQ0471177.1 putative membrane protein YfcA [Labrys wisconsinensis]
MLSDPLFWLVAVVAVTVVGISKGGFAGLGVLGVPVLAVVVPSPVKAAAILLPILVLQDWVSLLSYRRSVDRRVLLVPLAGALAGTLAGYLLAATIQDGHVRLVVGVIALAFAANWWIGVVQKRAEGPKPGDGAGLFWGLVAGFTSFVSHAGGPPYQIYSLPQRLKPELLAGTTAWFFAIVNLMKVVPYFVLGQFSRENLTISAALAPVAVVTTIFGVWLVRRADTTRFYRIIYALLVVVGLDLIWEGARSTFGL